MMKQILYWLGFAFLYHQGWQIEVLLRIQKFFISKDDDFYSFDLPQTWNRRSIYILSIKIIKAWKLS
jgi:hypothetical protein